MENLSTAIENSKDTKESFAKKTQIPFYRIATILYGKKRLSKSEKKKIKLAYGQYIFLTTTKQNV